MTYYHLFINDVELSTGITKSDIYQIYHQLFSPSHTIRFDNVTHKAYISRDNSVNMVPFPVIDIAESARKLGEAFLKAQQPFNELSFESLTIKQTPEDEAPKGMSPSYYHIQQKKKKRKNKRGKYVK